MEDFFFYRVLPVFIGAMILVVMLLFFFCAVALPRAAYVKSQCLEKGYPKSAVDYRLHGYCMNLQGGVTVDVQRITE